MHASTSDAAWFTGGSMVSCALTAATDEQHVDCRVCSVPPPLQVAGQHSLGRRVWNCVAVWHAFCTCTMPGRPRIADVTYR